MKNVAVCWRCNSIIPDHPKYRHSWCKECGSYGTAEPKNVEDKYEEFEKWYESHQHGFHTSQFDEKEIAYSSYLRGLEELDDDIEEKTIDLLHEFVKFYNNFYKNGNPYPHLSCNSDTECIFEFLEDYKLK